jgi:DNA-binding phage protein
MVLYTYAHTFMQREREKYVYRKREIVIVLGGLSEVISAGGTSREREY